MPDLSIIIPVYNVENYIHQCIDSILNQTFTNFELILVDDGSPDNCGKVCDEYAKKDKRIKVIHRENGGISAARNTGLQYAIGKYIAFVDSDDYVSTTMYETLIDVSRKTGADIVKCGYCEFVDNEVTGKKAFEEVKVMNNNDGQTLLRLYYEGVLYIVVWNSIYSSDLAKSVTYPEGYINEDNYASPMYLHLCKKIAVIPDTLYYYRQNYNGLSKMEAPNKKPLDKVVCYSMLHEKLCEYGLKDSWFCKKLRKRIVKYIYDLVKHKRFKLHLGQNFYLFMLNNLSVRKKVKLILWLIRKRIVLL